MKKIKFVLLITITIAFAMFSLVACGGDENNKCMHESTRLEYDTLPTCSSNGIARKICNTCTEIVESNVIIEKLEHDYYVVEGRESTCTSSGLTDEEKCRVCSTIKTPANVIEPLGHEYENDVCIRCNDNKYGTLEFVLNEEESGYIVSIGSYTGTEIVIPAEFEGKDVVEIASRGFYDRDSIISVVIPDSVTVIGAAAFGNCAALETVSIGAGVEVIGGSAFSSCKALLSVKFATECKITEIPQSCFDNCLELASINIPDTVTTLGKYSFTATGLTGIELHDGLCYIGEYAFAGSKLENINVPKSVEGIGFNAFQNNRVKSAILPFVGASRNGTPITETGYLNYADRFSYIGFSTVGHLEITDQQVIPAYAFDSARISKVILHVGVSEIGNYAFNGCTNLLHISLPIGLNSIGDLAFQSCSRLVEVQNGSSLNIELGSDDYGGVAKYALRLYDEGDSSIYTDENGFVFFLWGTDTALIDYVGSEKDITTPSTTPYGHKYVIYANTFQATGITSIVISNQVTSIGQRAFSNLGSLLSVSFEDSSSLTEIDASAFYGCTSLREFSIPGGVTEIKKDTFANCSSLSTLSIPSSVVRIDDAFYGCTELTLELPVNLAYANLYRFTKFKNTQLIDGVYYVDGWVIGIDRSAPPTTVNIEEDTVGISYQAFWFEGYNITELTIPTTVEHICEGALNGCTSLERLTIPFIGTHIEDTEEYPMQCLGINSNNNIVYINVSYTDYIPTRAFDNFKKLETVFINASVTEIGEYAFAACTSLKSVQFGEYSRLKTLGESAFEGCKSLGSVSFPAGVTEIPNGCFKDCSSIDALVLCEGITSIGYSAFMNCTNLKYVVIPKSIVKIYNDAFKYCSSLATIYYRGSEAEWVALRTENIYSGNVELSYDYNE